MKPRWILFLATGILAAIATGGAPLGAQSADLVRHSGLTGASAKPPAERRRQVFVLHSGLHTILSNPQPDWAIDIIRDILLKHGVPSRDIVMLPCPFGVASWQNMFPRDGLQYYLDSMKPASATSQKAYTRLDRLLQDQGVGDKDQLIWIGHSAGGQVGLTMAHLGANLPAYPDLAKVATAHHFDMVVTLGSPLGSVLLPEAIKQRHYFSPQDRVVHLACEFGPFALSWLGHQVNFMPIPAQLNASCMVRIFQGMEHPDWPDERVVLRILAEVRNDYQPGWRSLTLAPSAGASLARLMCRALEDQFQLSIEDPFE